MPINPNYMRQPEDVVDAIAKQMRKLKGKCLECETGLFLMTFPEEFYQKYGGQLREVLTLEPCSRCGSHLWMIKVPPKLDFMDKVLGEEDDDTRTS